MEGLAAAFLGASSSEEESSLELSALDFFCCGRKQGWGGEGAAAQKHAGANDGVDGGRTTGLGISVTLKGEAKRGVFGWRARARTKNLANQQK